ncbi:uncharacterized protein SCHCODRAFT_02638632 [Schizophyllum commune H4-8]|uniref:uncharacterized protein n=1 Tax=Schizophyllum commune (strain H4-8 / FGSC 9210) TaxID=578458 RepID=UPI00215E4B71|nr:uncharacterized protein SCHCODRAFT_02638632 [Schizophyllum commune H4-8]KAI5887657.1 hypothetical protein SCHCODRAFT_02638632 [Schizophyllum commune H4-8]
MALLLSHGADLALRHLSDLWPLLQSIHTSSSAAVALTLSLSALLYTRRKHSGQALTRYLVRTALAVNTVLLLHTIIFSPPPNMYRALGAPLGTRPHRLLYAMKEAMREGVIGLPYGADNLWERFQEEEMIDVYIRYGHDVLLQCEFCVRTRDFVTYALVGVALQYVGMAALIGLITIAGTDSEYYRPWGIICLVTTGLWEAWQTYTSNIEMLMFEDTTTTVHEDLLFRRQLVFIFLPIILHMLPSAVPLELQAQRDTLRGLRELQEKLKALALCDAAVLRSSKLRRLQHAFGERIERDLQYLHHARPTSLSTTPAPSNPPSPSISSPSSLQDSQTTLRASSIQWNTQPTSPSTPQATYPYFSPDSARMRVAQSYQATFLATVNAATSANQVW